MCEHGPGRPLAFRHTILFFPGENPGTYAPFGAPGNPVTASLVRESGNTDKNGVLKKPGCYGLVKNDEMQGAKILRNEA